MKANRYIFILLFGSALFLTSCENWLDVTASNEIRDEEHYSTELGFQQTLIGCYISMASPELYGRALTWSEIERMGRQYAPVIQSSSTYPYLQKLEACTYDDTQCQTFIDSWWLKLYNVIANANVAISEIDQKKSELSPIGYNIIKGELLAVRAYVHFDLLRLFGYGDWASRASELNEKLMLPYVKELSYQQTSKSTGADYLQNLIDDLQAAAALMKNDDPVVGLRPVEDYQEINYDGFYNYREGHLNYYAVQALLARVCMWSGSEAHKMMAAEAAEEVISRFELDPETNPDFNVMPTTMVNFKLLRSIDATTRSLFNEHIFDLQVYDLYNIQNSGLLTEFPDQASGHDIYLTEQDFEDIYDGSTTDFRGGSVAWAVANIGRVPLKLKVTSTSDDDNAINWRVPLIRIPEMYYIAAECYATSATPNLSKAIDKLDVIRVARGLDPTDRAAVNTSDLVVEEIAKEYRREFISEGVMFYYYKRTGATTMPGSVTEYTDTQYVLPIPDSESNRS